MCSTNVAFNIKTGENIEFICRILSFEQLFELAFSFFSFTFLRCIIVRAIHTKIAFAVLMAPNYFKAHISKSLLESYCKYK